MNSSASPGSAPIQQSQQPSSLHTQNASSGNSQARFDVTKAAFNQVDRNQSGVINREDFQQRALGGIHANNTASAQPPPQQQQQQQAQPQYRFLDRF
jgi:hypothetical protein